MNPDQNLTLETTQVVTPVAQPVNPVMPTVPPIPEMPKSNKKMFAIAGGILLVFVLVIGLVIFSQRGQSIPQASATPSPKGATSQTTPQPEVNTLGWKILAENNIPYTFKYPPQMDYVGAEAWLQFSATEGQMRFNYMFDGNKANKTLENFIASYVSEGNDPDPVPLEFDNLEKIIINGIAGYKATLSGTHQWYFLKSAEEQGIAIFTHELDMDQNSIETFDQILSTFELVSGSASDLKTYVNTMYDYSFGYPRNFTISGYDGDAGGAVTAETSNILIYEPGKSEYVDRMVDIMHFDLLIAPTPNWTNTSATVGGRAAIKYTSSSSEVKFDIYHVAMKSGGFEIMANKSASDASINQILSSFKFTD